MKLGEMLKYKARKYLYQFEQDNYYNKRKNEKESQQADKVYEPYSQINQDIKYSNQSKSAMNKTYSYDKSYYKEENYYAHDDYDDYPPNQSKHYKDEYYEDKDYYNVYPYGQPDQYTNPYQKSYYSSNNQEPYQTNYYEKKGSLSKNNIVGTLNDMEDYLEEKLSGLKKRK